MKVGEYLIKKFNLLKNTNYYKIKKKIMKKKTFLFSS